MFGSVALSRKTDQSCTGSVRDRAKSKHYVRIGRFWVVSGVRPVGGKPADQGGRRAALVTFTDETFRSLLLSVQV